MITNLFCFSHKNELHRWSKHKSKDLMLYVHGLSKETDCARRKQILHKHFENIEVCEHLMMVIFKDCAIDDNDIQMYVQQFFTNIKFRILPLS